MAHAGGRPKMYTTPEEMQTIIDEYFDSCFTDNPILNDDGKVIGVTRVQIRPFTITGLCIALDMDRDSLLNYEKVESYKEFFGTVSRAKLKCHNYAEELSLTSRNPNGVLFNLKNNYGWKDKTETALTDADGNNLTINVNITED